MHDPNAYENILDQDLAFSKSLMGKECARCHRAYVYSYFDKDSSSRDGRKNICPICLSSPRLSTEEHTYRYREMNENSSATEAQRRPNELDYLERDSIGRSLYHTEFVRRLKSLIGNKLIVADAHFLDEFSLYVEDPACFDTNGVRYIGFIPTGTIQEFSSYRYNRFGVPTDEVRRGYRGVLKKLIFNKYITEHECANVFGICDEKVWVRDMYNWRNNK